jgi:HD-GYP domain-containing protein (c-di-GMP phosphodiesterase class II)
MNKVVECYANDIPLGATLVDDIKNADDVLLCKADSIVDEHIMELLSNYNGTIKITLTEETQLLQLQQKYNLSDDVIEHINPDDIADEFSLELPKEVKEEALKGVVNLYNAKDNPEAVADIANEVGTTILDSITSNDSVNINLSKLKVCDDYTYKHSIDVATMAVLVARVLNYGIPFQKEVITAGILHDLGKTVIPEDILNKHGRLTKEEFEYIQRHPVEGYNLVKDCKDISEDTKQGILGHHENMDGTGYPARLSGDEIPIIAKILSVVDVYDALVADRPYRLAMKPADALEVMFTMSNKFDPVVFKAFLSIIIAYPVGSLVMTSMGDSCIVLKQNEGYPLRPVVKDLNTEEVIDLAHDYNSMNMVITEFIN